MIKTANPVMAFALLFVVSHGASFAADKKADKLYELYNSTSTSGSYKRVLQRRIDGLERREIRRGKAGPAARARALAAAAPPASEPRGVSPVAAPSADPEFKLGEVYCYPNPAKRANPAFHIETGLADKVELKLYDISGDPVHETAISGAPRLIDDGQGPQYAYEYQWDVKNVGSGVYIFSITSRQGDKSLKKTGRCAVIK